MINILLTGVGGQGTVLAAKVLAQAAQEKGWQVRTAETIGMAQRGGSVTSHVRMGNAGEEVFAPLLAHASANLIVAFEPAEGARVLSFLAPGGTLVSASTPIQPITAALSQKNYSEEEIIEKTAQAVKLAKGNFIAANDAKILDELGNRKALNTVLLACALATGCVPLNIDDLRKAVSACVKEQFVALNLQAIDKVVDS